jgi:hypothetical protein
MTKKLKVLASQLLQMFIASERTETNPFVKVLSKTTRKQAMRV